VYFRGIEENSGIKVMFLSFPSSGDFSNSLGCVNLKCVEF